MKRRTRLSTSTGIQAVRAYVDTFPTMAAAAREIAIGESSMDPDHLGGWLARPERGLKPATAQAIALAVDVPLEAILFPLARICDLPCEKARRAAA